MEDVTNLFRSLYSIPNAMFNRRYDKTFTGHRPTQGPPIQILLRIPEVFRSPFYEMMLALIHGRRP